VVAWIPRGALHLRPEPRDGGLDGAADHSRAVAPDLFEQLETIDGAAFCVDEVAEELRLGRRQDAVAVEASGYPSIQIHGATQQLYDVRTRHSHFTRSR
jgi:hypothetical protein